MSEEKTFKPWRLNWTHEYVERFWNWWGSNPALLKHYFARRNGEAVLDQISRHVKFSGVIVDLGAGPGYIVDLLIKRGVATIAIDTSPDSLNALTERMKGFQNFLGARVSNGNTVPLDDKEADVVLLVETIEHLGDEILEDIINETYRVLKPGGWLTVTTPNDENLAELETICPHCGCVYHLYQHERSWSPVSLAKYMLDAGFYTVVCKGTLFSHFPRWLRPFHYLAYLVLKMKFPHLIYIGQKPTAGG